MTDFPDRRAIFKSHDLVPDYFHVDEDEERIALERANLVWAIKSEEEALFRRIERSAGADPRPRGAGGGRVAENPERHFADQNPDIVVRYWVNTQMEALRHWDMEWFRSLYWRLLGL